MPKRALTEAAIKRIKPPKAGQIDYFDQGYPGLALRVGYGGGKSFVYFYRAGGPLRRMTLGAFPAITLAKAREVWRTAREDAQAGRDPATVRKRESGATDFQGVFEEWLRRDQAKNKTKDAVERLLSKDVLPLWGPRQIGDISRRDVRDVIDAVADRGSPITARRLHAHIHRLFSWALERDIVEANPAANMAKPGSETKRERVLSDEELKAVWNAAGKLGWPFGPAIQLLILTGARRQEIGALRWTEIVDTQICMSGGRTKNGQPHSIPLAVPATIVLQRVPRIADSDLLFTTNGKTPISGWSKAKTEIGNLTHLAPWTIHDLRRTVATGMQRLGVNLQTIEAVLGHVSGSRSGVVGVYQRHSFDTEKRAALEAWGTYVAFLVEAR